MPRSFALFSSRRLVRIGCLLVAAYLLASCAQIFGGMGRLHIPESIRHNSAVAPIPVIIFAFNRADNLRITIDSILAAVPLLSLHPIFIS